MLADILSLLLGTLASLLSLALLARFWMQWVGAPFRNPVGEAILALTNWLVLPLRRLIPAWRRADLASLVAVWGVQLAYHALMASLAGFGAWAWSSLPALLALALIAGLRLFVWLLIGVVIVAALLSWLAPYAPARSLFDTLAAPLLAPLRRLVPSLGGLDFSPLVALLLLQVALIVLEHLAR